ncbi:MAG: hypothetical protein KBG83_07160 [Bacteroidetes bacterium]|nr:hypothetical protein [Bacteroidota bacterium]
MKTKKIFLAIASISILVAFSLSIISSEAYAQKATYGQQIAIAKVIKPGLTTIGVIGSKLDDKSIEGWTRAGLALGVKIIIGLPQNVRDVPSVYKTLVKDKKVELLLIADANDELMTGMGFDYLREVALNDHIGIFAPKPEMVNNGAICTVISDNGQLKAYVNQKLAQVLGLTVPTESGPSISYVIQ